ncbi:hypothetical protein BH18ACI5_BH18ACI5_26350 [soil metagenome]
MPFVRSFYTAEVYRLARRGAPAITKTALRRLSAHSARVSQAPRAQSKRDYRETTASNSIEAGSGTGAGFKSPLRRMLSASWTKAIVPRNGPAAKSKKRKQGGSELGETAVSTLAKK